MNWRETQVAQFNEKIKLDSVHVDRVIDATKRFKEFCEKDAELKAGIAENVFLQGSVATKTVIRPLAGDEFDVDAVYPFNLRAFRENPTPSSCPPDMAAA